MHVHTSQFTYDLHTQRSEHQNDETNCVRAADHDTLIGEGGLVDVGMARQLRARHAVRAWLDVVKHAVTVGLQCQSLVDPQLFRTAQHHPHQSTTYQSINQSISVRLLTA